MPNTLTGAAASSRACNRQHIPPPAVDGQADQRACDQCGKPFMPRQHTGGSAQRFCCGSCRLDWHKERQRRQRTRLYAGQPRQSIPLPSGDLLMPRAKFAREVVGTSEKGIRKFDLPVTYVGAVAHVPRDVSLQIIADTLKQRNPPQRRRAVRS